MITRTRFTTGRFMLILCTAMMATSLQAFARHPRPRVQSGTIEAIDRSSRTLRIQADGGSPALTLVWNDRTTFTGETGPSLQPDLPLGSQ